MRHVKDFPPVAPSGASLLDASASGHGAEVFLGAFVLLSRRGSKANFADLAI
jgi:hypothetical protein